MIAREQLKQQAKQQIKGKIGILFLMSIIVAGISILVNYVPIIGSLANAIVIAPAFSISLIMIYMKVADYEEIKVGDIFEGFYHFWGAFKITFLVGLFTFLWSLLFVIPGIVKAYSYSMAFYIYAENKDMGALEAIRKSKEMMHGHKMDLFVLALSFLGWGLLCAITFGIAYIYVGPYMQTTYMNFYRAIKPVAPKAEESIEAPQEALIVEEPVEVAPEAEEIQEVEEAEEAEVVEKAEVAQEAEEIAEEPQEATEE